MSELNHLAYVINVRNYAIELIKSKLKTSTYHKMSFSNKV